MFWFLMKWWTITKEECFIVLEKLVRCSSYNKHFSSLFHTHRQDHQHVTFVKTLKLWRTLVLWFNWQLMVSCHHEDRYISRLLPMCVFSFIPVKCLKIVSGFLNTFQFNCYNWIVLLICSWKKKGEKQVGGKINK